MRSAVIAVSIIAGGLLGATNVYDVDLSDNDNDMLAHAQQSFVATADSISDVAFFCGRKIVTGRYRFRLTDSTGLVPITDWIVSDSASIFDYELVSAEFNSPVNVRKGFTYCLEGFTQPGFFGQLLLQLN